MVVAGCIAYGVLGLRPLATGVSALGAFSGTASADGVRVGLSIPSFLIIENFVDGGGPTAQAVLDSLGTSRAFASLPYPGETGVSLPGLIGTLTGKSIPGYPFYVDTSNPTRTDSRADQPGYHLASHSGTTSSSATAQAGEATTTGIEGGAFSTATVSEEADGTLVSESDTRVDISLGVLRLTGLESGARVVLSPDGRATRASSLRVGALSLGGITIGVTDQGLVAGGLVVPLGNLLGGLAQALSQGATTVKFLPASQTSDSILSAGLLITTSQPLPVVGHPAEISITVGRAFASGAASVTPAFPAGSAEGSGGPNGVGGALPVTAAAPTLGGGAGSPAPAPVSAPPAGQTGVAAPVIRRLPMTVSRWAFYPIVILAALVVAVASLGNRIGVGRRRSWSS